MKAYADTSWWIASKVRDETFHSQAICVFDDGQIGSVVWTPWQRVEVFNTLRQLERCGVLISDNAGRIITTLEREVQLGYWPHVEFRWTEAVRRACRLSAEHAATLPIRGMDLFHVAIAQEIDAQLLLTFDSEQAALAEAAGLQVYVWT